MKVSEFVFDYLIYGIIDAIKKSESWRIIYRFSRLDKKQESNNKSHQYGVTVT